LTSPGPRTDAMVRAVARELAPIVADLVRREAADQIADLVAERLVTLLARRESGAHLLTTQQVADRLGRSAGWVRDHADELGGEKRGTGSKPRWGFSAVRVAAYVEGTSR
jgi:hypothetical protein